MSNKRGRMRLDLAARGKVGRLTPLFALEEPCQGIVFWECLCECGNRVQKPTSTLVRFVFPPSCGCLVKEKGVARGRNNPNRQKALVMRRKGRSSTEVAEVLGISRERACQYFRKEGLGGHDYLKDFTLEHCREKVEELASQGVPRWKIRERLGVSMAMMKVILGKHDKETHETHVRARLDRKHCHKRLPTPSRLTIVEILKPDSHHGRKCICRCSCGNETTILLSNAISGNQRSCGCALREYHNRGKK